MSLAAGGFGFNFGAEVATGLADLRRAAESRMLSTWLIQAGPTTAYNPVTGLDETSYAVEFATPGRLRVRSPLSQHAQQAGGGAVVEVTRELHIPVSAPLVPEGAIATCVGLDPTSDPAMVNTVLRIEGPAEGDQTTARRLKVTELASAKP